jgi:riboflavin synthase
MFTGIIEETGTIARIDRKGKNYNLKVRSNKVLEGTISGDSIAVNGTCLTVTDLTSNAFSVGLAPETLQRTNLGSLVEGSEVNLERSLTPSSRMGGHIVQGHVDGVGTVTKYRPDGSSLWVHVEVNPEMMRLIVPKGFVAVDGVSLTVVDTTETSFSVMLVEYTQQNITLARQQVGYSVNIETDILGKYIDNILSHRTGRKGGLSLAFLADHGYK